MTFFKSSVIAASFLATASSAEVCDYRPSSLLGEGTSRAALATGAGIGTAGGAATAAGFYTLVHASSGLTMLGSTLAGTSAAGTLGIIAGTGGAIGGTAAVVLNPLVWVPAAIVGVGGAGFEAACAYMVDERITEYDDIMFIMRNFAESADPNYFRLVENTLNPFVEIRVENGNSKTYRVENLFIVEGILKHDDFGFNSTIGRVVLVQPTDAVPE